MYQLKRFTDVLWRSLTDRTYYSDIYRSKFGFSAKYLLALLFILSFASILRLVVFVTPRLPNLERGIKEFKSKVGELYPAQLVITLKDGKLSTNQSQPVYFDLPRSWTSQMAVVKDHFIVIDPKAVVDDFPKYNTYMLLTGSVIAVQESDRTGGYRIKSFSEITDNITMNRSKYDEMVTMVSKWADRILPLVTVFLVLAVFIGPVVLTGFDFLGRLIFIAVLGLVLMVIAKMIKINISYRALFRLSMHGITLPVLVGYILEVLNIYIPLLFTFIFLTWMTMVMIELKDHVSAPNLPQAQK